MFENPARRRALMILMALVLTITAMAAAAPEGKVNINTAHAEALALLPRVGGVVAKRIVDFRRENGEFSAIEDLMLVQGIGERTFELMEPYLTLEGETTLKEKVRVSSSGDEG